MNSVCLSVCICSSSSEYSSNAMEFVDDIQVCYRAWLLLKVVYVGQVVLEQGDTKELRCIRICQRKYFKV